MMKKINKNKIKKILLKYFIKYIIILAYNSQMNRIIKQEYQFIINILFKMIKSFIKKNENN